MTDFDGNIYVRELKKAILLALVIGLFFLCYKLPYNEAGEIFGISWNVPAYIVSLAVAFVAMIFVNMLPFKSTKTVTWVLMVAEYLYIYITYSREANIFAGEATNTFLRGEVDKKIFAVFILLSAVILEKIIETSEANNKLYRFVVNLVISILAAAFSYSANPFKDLAGKLYHTEAYVNSIINVSHFVPYSDDATTVYGHYGIIYLPFVKLLGNNLCAIMISISITVFVIHFLLGYIINSFLKNDVLYYVSVFAILGMATVYRGTGNYFQVYPHRILFPIIGIAYIVQSRTSQIGVRKRIIAEVLIGTLAIIWNIESGIVCLFSMLAIEVFDKFEWKVSLVIKKVLLVLGTTIISFFLSYALVNLYNVICGGKWTTIAQYIYPIGVKSYMVDELVTSFQAPIYYYVLYVWVFCSGVFPVIINQTKGQMSRLVLLDSLRLSTGISGLLIIVYFINRQAFSNIQVAHFQLLIMLILGAQEYLDNRDKRYSVTYISMIVICAMMVESLICVGRTIDNRVETVWEDDSLKRDASDFENFMVDGSLIIGIGAPVLCEYMGIDSGAYMTDHEDLFEFDYLEHIILDNDRVLVSEVNQNSYRIYDILYENGYTLNRTFTGENIIYNEFVR